MPMLTLAAKVAALEAGRKETKVKVHKVLAQPAEVEGRKVDSLRVKQTRTVAGLPHDLALSTAVVRMAHRAMSCVTGTDLGFNGGTIASLRAARTALVGGLAKYGIAPEDMPDAIKQACDELGASLRDDPKFSIGLEGTLAAIGQARCFAEVLGAEAAKATEAEAAKAKAAVEAAEAEAAEAEAARKAKRAQVAAKAQAGIRTLTKAA